MKRQNNRESENKNGKRKQKIKKRIYENKTKKIL